MSEKPIASLFPAIYGWQLNLIQECARQYGYAIAVHGTMHRDLDLIAVPWRENVCWADDFVHQLCVRIPAEILQGDPHTRPHGRLVYTLLMGGEFFIDLSVLPPVTDPLRRIEENIGLPEGLKDAKHTLKRGRELLKEWESED